MQYSSTPFQTDNATASLLPTKLAWLVGEGIVTFNCAAAALEISMLLGVEVESVLRADFGVLESQLIKAHHAITGAQLIDPTTSLPDPSLLAEFGPEIAQHRCILPWRKLGTETTVLTSDPENFEEDLPALTATFGQVRMALATETQIRLTIEAHFGHHLARQAATRLEASMCARDWRTDKATVVTGVLFLAVLTGLIFAPGALLGGVTLFALTTLGLLTAMISGAALSGLKNNKADTIAPTEHIQLPTITLLIPLLHERNIAGHLLERLRALDYPRALLDVCLILEEGDETTLETLNNASLPDWTRIIIVPDVGIRTKPKALNYALNNAKGAVIGVYDAEDAPSKSQLLVVARTFAKAPSDVGCLQAALDYYNPSANWLTRCFTVEYASWFRVVLPGIARLGLLVPLGGTSIFFRREVLYKLGAWDAHNVTEDADLGIRIARSGYKTVFIPSVTYEEANGHFWPWVRQRSRWLKGYAITYLVHMRRPLQLLSELGAWKFLGFQVLFFGTLTNFVFAPLIWLFWLSPILGLSLYTNILPQALIWIGLSICVFSSLANMVLAGLGLKRAGKFRLFGWYLTMIAYFPLASLAVYKGLYEMIRRPFFWDKTEHGVLLPNDP